MLVRFVKDSFFVIKAQRVLSYLPGLLSLLERGSNKPKVMSLSLILGILGEAMMQA
jgi:hypothetical protein